MLLEYSRMKSVNLVLWITAAAFFAVVWGTSIWLSVNLLIDEKDGVLYNYESPRDVLSTRPGVEGPAVTEFGMVSVRGRRCVSHDTVVQLSVVYYNSVDLAGGRVQDPENVKGVLKPRPKGCFDEDILFSLPQEVTPGIWHIEAVERSVSTGELQTWYSEPFTVTERP